MRIMDRKSTLVGNEFRIEFLIKVEGEIQYHYVSCSRNMSQHEKDNAIQDYINKNVKFRNLTDEEQECHIRAFKGGRR